MNNNNTKKQQQKRPFRERMLRYLNRHKVVKQRPILPRTFANLQKLSVARLNPVKQTETKKPIISNNVKARLESDLEHLLENQHKAIRRVRPPESYISLKTDQFKLPRLPSGSLNENRFENDIELHEPHHRIESAPKSHLISSAKSDGQSKTKRIRRLPSSASQIDSISSFDFDTTKNQIRAGFGSAAPKLSDISDDFFERSANDNFNPEKMGWQFDELKFTEPPSLSPNCCELQPSNKSKPNDVWTNVFNQSGSKHSKISNSTDIKHTNREKMSHKSNASRIIHSTPSEKFIDDQSFSLTLPPFKSKQHRKMPSPIIQHDSFSSFDFDTDENQIRAGHGSATPKLSDISDNFFMRSSNRNFNPDDMNWSFDEPNYTEPPSVSPSSFGFRSRNRYHSSYSKQSPTHGYDLNRFEVDSHRKLDRDEHGRRTRTRIIRKCISRRGESPFAEQIIITKVKQPY